MLNEAEEEIVFSFFNIKKPKGSEKKRHLSSLEINQDNKKQDETMEAISKHISGNKITKAKLFAYVKLL